MNQKDIKLLWGRAANRCSICRIELSQDASAENSTFTLGEQAHIVGESNTGPRGTSRLSIKERNSYHNIILLCPNHHTEIDNSELDWPVEILHQKKSEHELWVSETLSSVDSTRSLAKDLAVGAIIDTAVNLCRLDSWRDWTSRLLGPEPNVDVDMPDDLFEFRQRVSAALWPADLEELERSAATLAITIQNVFFRLQEHGEVTCEVWRPIKFYKAYGYNPNYDADVIRYDEWIDTIYSLTYEATKAANWFADVVRRDYNPMFFAETGRFIIMEGPFSDLSHHARLLQYDQEQRDQLPHILLHPDP